jgi:hypothetical protein
VPDVRIYLSYDVDHDGDLFKELVAQSERSTSGFQISGHSEARAMSERWEERLRARMRAADEVIVLCGEHTTDSVQVSAELRIVQEEGVPYFLLWGRREIMCTRPVGARPDDCMYSWTGEILRDQIVQTIRKAQPLAVPANLKRVPSMPRSG